MTTLNIVAWIVIGGLVGLVLAALTRRPETGSHWLTDLITGLFGGVIGGVLLSAVGGNVGTDFVGVNLAGAVVAVVGAVILVGLVEWWRSTQP
jgi:uncharacterized membrane protein YeaQ/YmgE (transglycosylase-associated protein family)